MHNTSIGEIKGTSSGNSRNVPRKGTKIRKVYDLFMSNKGKVIDFKVDIKCSTRLDYLVNFYGLDIRRILNGKWCLVGEWFGKVYVDYVVNKDI